MNASCWMKRLRRGMGGERSARIVNLGRDAARDRGRFTHNSERAGMPARPKPLISRIA